MRQARQGREEIARFFFRKRWLFGAYVLLVSQSAPGAILFHRARAEIGDSGLAAKEVLCLLLWDG
jgi:hypothetical protein